LHTTISNCTPRRINSNISHHCIASRYYCHHFHHKGRISEAEPKEEENRKCRKIKTRFEKKFPEHMKCVLESSFHIYDYSGKHYMNSVFVFFFKYSIP